MHKMERESPPIHHPPTLLHPALLAAAQHGGSPDYSHMRAVNMESKYGIVNMDNGDRNSDCNSGDISYDGMKPTISFLCKDFSKNLSSQHVRNLIFYGENSPLLKFRFYSFELLGAGEALRLQSDIILALEG